MWKIKDKRNLGKPAQDRSMGSFPVHVRQHPRARPERCSGLDGSLGACMP